MYANHAAEANAPLGAYHAPANALPPPVTISSGIARVEDLAPRLQEIIKQLSVLSDSIGGPRPVGIGTKESAPTASGAVSRLCDAAHRGHVLLDEVGDLLGCIQRALG